MTSPFVLVCDAAPAAGLGHLSRSTAIAHALAEVGFETERLALGTAAPVTRDELGWQPLADLTSLVQRADASVIVLDGYELDRAVVDAVAAVAPLVWFDDFGDAPEAARLVVAPARQEPPSQAPGAATLLSGLEHAPLGRRFWAPPPRDVAAAIGRVLVTMGGADARGATARLAAGAHAAAADAEIVVVRGPHAEITELPEGVALIGPLPGLGDELAAADLVVGAAGQTMLEAAALGTPALVAVVAANQRVGALELERRGAIEIFDPQDADGLRERIVALNGDRSARSRMSGAGQAAIDGQGARRIAAAVAALARGG